jgi:hypothetical protein
MKITLFIRIMFVISYLCNSGISLPQENPQIINYPDSEQFSTGISINEVTIDSDLSLQEAMHGKQIPGAVINTLELISVQYYDFGGKLRQGQIVVHKDAVNDIKEIFNFIRDSKFPVEKVVPISEYKWSDEESMKDNNTSAFNYRFVSGTRIHSMHASGLAIDINPLQNPYIKNHIVLPKDAVYDTTKPGTLSADSDLVKEFKKRGWSWGGDWKNLKDYQHFEKKLK